MTNQKPSKDSATITVKGIIATLPLVQETVVAGPPVEAQTRVKWGTGSLHFYCLY